MLSNKISTIDKCVDRLYQNKSDVLKCRLGKKQSIKCYEKKHMNDEETKYKKYNYSGQFHKCLIHNVNNGLLENNQDYEKMRDSILSNNQTMLNLVPLYPNTHAKLANPLASLSTVLIGAPQCAIPLQEPPKMSSKSAAAEMVENYSMAIARDVSFVNYSTDLIISKLLNSKYMNNKCIIKNMLYKPLMLNNKFNECYHKMTNFYGSKNLFRGHTAGEEFGPLISQLLLLNVPIGSVIMQQKYMSLITKNIASIMNPPGRIEWGINKMEMINIQNCIPVQSRASQSVQQNTYIYNGRSLAEAVHNDVAYQYYYQAALILNKLGVSVNPTFPVYKNQSSFITGPALPNVLCSLGTITDIAIKHAWYWKWKIYRKLRPEVFSLWVSNIKDGSVSNDNYNISDVLLLNEILNDIYKSYGSYTLPLCFPEGSPVHPSYPAGHAVCAGANCTLLKIFYDGDQKWTKIPGIISGELVTPSLPGIIQADENGSSLISYNESDVNDITVNSEINKLASNISLGRDWAGVHYRSDSCAGMNLGEEIAIKYMEDYLSTYVENNLDGSVISITFRKFNGELCIIKPTICR